MNHEKTPRRKQMDKTTRKQYRELNTRIELKTDEKTQREKERTKKKTKRIKTEENKRTSRMKKLRCITHGSAHWG